MSPQTLNQLAENCTKAAFGKPFNTNDMIYAANLLYQLARKESESQAANHTQPEGEKECER